MKLPESWVETTVGRIVVDLQPGFAQKPGEEDDGTTPQIRTHNISPNGKITLEGIKHITASTKELQRYSLASGDIVFNNTNSEEWVGKTAVFDQEGEYVFSNHMTRLRAHPELVNPEYLAGYLQLLWSMGYSKTRAKRWVSQAGIEGAALSSFKVPLPTLPEQQHIVDVLRQAEAITQLQGTLDELLFKIKHQLFVEIFGDPNPKHNTTWPIAKLGSLATVATGGTPSRGQADSYVGSIAWAKSTDLTDEAISSTEETITALGVQRSNAKIHPKHTILLAMYGQGQTRGRTAKLLIDAACNQACAALLPSDELLPDYLWVWLQLSYDSVRSLGRGGQQENLNLDIVRSLKLPKPPLPLQQEFARRLDQLLEVNAKSRMARRQAAVLLKELSIEALTGTITERWREQHSEEIAVAAATRDALLRERGAKLTTRPVEPVPLMPDSKDSQRPSRQWLLAELSEFQRRVLAAFSAYPEQPLLAEDANVFARFCDDENVLELLQAFGPSLNNRIRRTLSQLSALGLIAKVTLPKQNPQTGERDYLKAFRPLREDEYTKMADVETLRRALSSGDVALRHYFTVVLDYETSEHAGAGGMFQVAALSDEDDKDRTDLVDQGKHYAALDELASDIARRLGVRADQIELEE